MNPYGQQMPMMPGMFPMPGMMPGIPMMPGQIQPMPMMQMPQSYLPVRPFPYATPSPANQRSQPMTQYPNRPPPPPKSPPPAKEAAATSEEFNIPNAPKSFLCFVGRIDTSLSEAIFTSLLAKLGPVTNVRRIRNTLADPPRDFAFCAFSTLEGTLNAIRVLPRLSLWQDPMTVVPDRKIVKHLEEYHRKKMAKTGEIPLSKNELENRTKEEEESDNNLLLEITDFIKQEEAAERTKSKEIKATLNPDELLDVQVAGSKKDKDTLLAVADEIKRFRQRTTNRDKEMKQEIEEKSRQKEAELLRMREQKRKDEKEKKRLEREKKKEQETLVIQIETPDPNERASLFSSFEDYE
ncbi:putative RNA-binding protein 25 [Blattamonas nauphoetae]|uniref:RNA-binding protein 25 n=1 Tax=Blattamonas nauphoetae TaxID=2049346 RepID=A0ABQ9YKC9_9EUKA|nr:putative RNA-binding protein 25 [Blattamonas nauphoetae]